MLEVSEEVNKSQGKSTTYHSVVPRGRGQLEITEGSVGLGEEHPISSQHYGLCRPVSKPAQPRQG